MDLPPIICIRRAVVLLVLTSVLVLVLVTVLVLFVVPPVCNNRRVVNLGTCGFVPLFFVFHVIRKKVFFPKNAIFKSKKRYENKDMKIFWS